VPRRTKVILAWALAVGWALFIWGLGTDGFSLTSTSRFLGPLVTWLVPSLDNASRDLVLIGIRKLTHIAEYAAFALLIGRAIWLSFGQRMRIVCFLCLAAVGALAVADETRQSYSALRTGSGYDVGLDIFGGAVAIAALFALKRRLGRPLFGDPAAKSASASETSTELGPRAETEPAGEHDGI
jgi:VanZ family protein